MRDWYEIYKNREKGLGKQVQLRYELDKSQMEDVFDEQKTWLKINPMLNAPSIFETIIKNSKEIQEKEETMKAMIPNIRETERISVNYEGATYYVDQGEVEYRTFDNYPTITVRFMPTPGRKIAVNNPKDSRCAKCPPNDFDIDKVTFNGPKTIVEWKDGTKTIVNCDDEVYDPEKGLAMAIVKKAFGNKGNYYNAFRKAMENARYYNQPEEPNFQSIGEMILAGMLAGLKEEKRDE